MKGIAFVLVIIALLFAPDAVTARPAVSVLASITAKNDAGKQSASAFFDCLTRTGLVSLSPVKGPAFKYPPRPDERILTDATASYYMYVARKLKAEYLVIIEAGSGGPASPLRARVFTVSVKKFTFSTEKRIGKRESIQLAACRLANAVGGYVSGGKPVIDGISAGMGSHYNRVFISWHCPVQNPQFTILRADTPGGRWKEIGITRSLSFSDTSADEGLLYWYRVRGTSGQNAFLSVPVKGYRKPASPKGLTLKDIFRERNKSRPVPANDEEKNREKRDSVLLKKYYESYFTMNLIYLIGRIYLNRGEIQAFRDFDSYSWDHPKKTLHLTKRNCCYIKFHSDRFFRFVRDMDVYSIPRAELLPRMIKNTIVFCIRRGEVETRLPNGRIKYIPYFEAGGLGTEYWRDFKGWKSYSLMFASSDPEMKKKINEAEKKGY